MRKRLFYFLSVLIALMLLTSTGFAAAGLQNVTAKLEEDNRITVSGKVVGGGGRDLTVRARFSVRELIIECRDPGGDLESDQRVFLEDFTLVVVPIKFERDGDFLFVGDLNSYNEPHCPNDNWTQEIGGGYWGEDVIIGVVDSGSGDVVFEHTYAVE